MALTRDEWLERREFSHAKDVSDTSSTDETDEGSDDGRPSFSDDSRLGTTTSTCARVRHDDHWDRVVDDNPWERPVDIWEWRSSCVQQSAHTKTNAELEQEDKTREWLEKLENLTSLHLQVDPGLLDPWGNTGISIPLCEAPNGDEYRLALTHDGFSVPTVWCPATLGRTVWNGQGCWARLQNRADLPDGGTPPPLRHPTMAIALGSLAVVTASRSKWFGSDRVTEYTDYDVVVDISSDDLSLWIIASRSQLDLRAEGTVWQPYVPCLPIFDGLMSSDDDGGYDLACIAPSIRLLRGRISDQAKAPTWSDMCAWVRKTRTDVDAVARIPHKDEVKAVGEAATKKLAARANRGIVGRVWGYLTGVC